MNRDTVTLTLRDYDIAAAIIAHLRSLAGQGNNDSVTTIPEATYDRS